MKLRAAYTVRGKRIRRVWVEHEAFFMATHWADGYLEVSRPRWERATEAQREVALAHELAHLLWWYDHGDEEHPTWLIGHDSFARYAVRVNRIIRTGTDPGNLRKRPPRLRKNGVRRARR